MISEAPADHGPVVEDGHAEAATGMNGLYRTIHGNLDRPCLLSLAFRDGIILRDVAELSRVYVLHLPKEVNIAVPGQAERVRGPGCYINHETGFVDPLGGNESIHLVR